MCGGVFAAWGVVMATSQSKQSFAITSLNLDEINDALVRIQNELDRLAGLRGPVVFHDAIQVLDEDAEIYTMSNVTADRALNANSTSIDELADVLGTLIEDLQTVGVIQ